MWARRFLTIIFVLTLLAVAAAFAFFEWGGDILLRQATPQGHFQAARGGTGADYSQAENWVSNPRLNPTGVNDPAEWLPDGVTHGAVGPASVFYVHPTTYLTGDRWNAPIHTDPLTEARTILFVKSQASAFNAAGRIWAPRYRQAAYGAFLLSSDDARKALDLAYADVSAAFDEFLRQAPKDGPIIIAGHSQGALQLQRLLREKIAGSPIAKRIVAAYIAGWPISATADLPSLGLPACAAPDQTGCILSWMSFGDPPNASFFGQWEKTKGPAGGERRQEDALCVNPLTGTQDGAAPAQANRGTLVPTPNFQSATFQPGLVGARCSGGLLMIDGDIPAFNPPPLPGSNFHIYDYALFWGSIRTDAARRLAAWRR
jgi:hypothetical protein